MLFFPMARQQRAALFQRWADLLMPVTPLAVAT
jgi:hypothetical protein